MKSKIQMRRAKHMIAIWLKPGEPESLVDALHTAKHCWNHSSQRILRTWAKELYNNPLRYEFTGMAYKELKLTSYFTQEEIEQVLANVQMHVESTEHDYAIRGIIHHKWVYGLSTEDAIKFGIEVHNGGKLSHRPKTPVLK